MSQLTVPEKPSATGFSWAALPGSLRLLVWTGAVAVIALYALPIQMTLDRAGVEATIVADNPGLPAADLGTYWVFALIYSYGLHTLTAAAFVWLGWKVFKRRNWARIALSAFLVFATGASLVSAFNGSMYLWAVIVGDTTHLLGLVLLWLPATRDYLRR